MDKKALLLIGAGALLLSAKKSGKKSSKKKVLSSNGLSISSDCKTIKIIDGVNFYDTIYKKTEEYKNINSNYPLIELSIKIFNDILPNCKTFPNEPTSNDAFSIYRNVVNYVILSSIYLNWKEIFNIFTDKDAKALGHWYKKYENGIPDEIRLENESMVGISPNYKNMKIGSSFEEAFKSSIKEFTEDGITKDELNTYATVAFPVLFGKTIMPISELNQDKATIIKLKAYLNKLIEENSK